MTSPSAGEGRTRAHPPLGGSLVYLLLNFPLGIASFVFLVTLTAVGFSTAIIWIGVPVSALVILATRGAARLERARTYALLDRYIPIPYRPLPEAGQKQRWKVRLGDAATWRDITYFLLLFPIGIAHFVVLVTTWSVSLGLLTLPVYYRYLPEGAYFFPSYDLRWITVDSTLTALPWAALGVLCVAVSVVLTRALAAGHAHFAAALLGPTAKRAREAGDSFPDAPVLSPVAG